MLNLKTKILAASFLLLCLIAATFIFISPPLSKIVQALTGNYSKAVGNQLTVSDWNNLPADFVARTGGTPSAMQGNLDMASHQINNLSAPTGSNDAVTKGAMDTAIAAAVGGSDIKDAGGNNLRMVCGSTNLIAGVNCDYYDAAHPEWSIMRVTIDTSAAGSFTQPPQYFSSLEGAYHYLSYGLENIYPSGAPYNSFSLRIRYLGLNYDGKIPTPPYINLTPAQVQAWGWKVNWCVIGR